MDERESLSEPPVCSPLPLAGEGPGERAGACHAAAAPQTSCPYQIDPAGTDPPGTPNTPTP
ncbi:hypothetical protein CBM2586_A10229 [Cupriavidus phytorum]|uniref:Uncharacterized protein n=1 Tax=Cupriavidus taiwanensis TaxID=164546 RepID=A0A375B9I9_9BURK|nr:hypothetical protein CBM2586_A10229 [Cupriavidus taiwanensis]